MLGSKRPDLLTGGSQSMSRPTNPFLLKENEKMLIFFKNDTPTHLEIGSHFSSFWSLRGVVSDRKKFFETLISPLLILKRFCEGISFQRSVLEGFKCHHTSY